jgi:hypothetical protein
MTPFSHTVRDFRASTDNSCGKISTCVTLVPHLLCVTKPRRHWYCITDKTRCSWVSLSMRWSKSRKAIIEYQDTLTNLRCFPHLYYNFSRTGGYTGTIRGPCPTARLSENVVSSSSIRYVYSIFRFCSDTGPVRRPYQRVYR